MRAPSIDASEGGVTPILASTTVCAGLMIKWDLP
jgi:hypothetical protein